ncbi:uncharacterized protein N7459_005256 [Penicillium hispanicum]|uniref:uncharacterized protein n=1 Tax=Penicillium hispanicum TaxID=1080232 RepID=UPI0025414660|nr:uncharacterized protein N7459_005256 [Penicillium hispanicum]KAJ5585456.1 hypothetical protein N7459_005256 [Penicillium hispanicum]
MAEQSSRDVVDQTLSGGEPSPSDVPASINDKHTAGGDAGETKHIATTSTTQILPDHNPNELTRETLDSQAERAGGDKDAGGSSMVGCVAESRKYKQLKPNQDSSKQGTGLVATRALELNGLASASDGGDDTASQGGSESDTSRTDGRNHTRAGSAKRPGTFKPVSFTKFAVPKAPGTTAPPKVPEKVPSASTTPLGTPQPSSRPRLVAKTTAGMRDSFSKTGAGGAKPGGSGPDPSQVWNKNRPVQPTPPKHLTDEELKQQYGIHMTSRIQEDGGGTEAKWADIDDDEDDWAPETIEWTDGTKVTLTHNEPAPPPPDSSQTDSKDAPPTEAIAAQDPIRIAAPKPTTSVGPNPTVLRLGANAERQAKAANTFSKGTNDRVPSGSTSPAPPPAKSPWAALPPVSSVSPVNPNMHPPPPVSSQPRYPASYPHRDDGHHAPFPPKEIAADDFNRTWRDTPSGAPRELYNSRSGRYEPVADTRRGSWRADQGPRALAVLQRPSHGEPSGPAEPSAAFQTYRSSQEGMGWNRRRTSSNVSGGSGGFGRRMSFGRTDAPPRYIEARRGSQVNGMIDPALIDREPGHFRDASPTQQHAGQGWAAHRAVSVSDGSPVEQQAPSAAALPVPQEDPVALQERIMKEKRLEARQRRIEQEEKEQAAKEERIRQKLAALGPAPDKPKRKDSVVESRKPQAPTAPATTIHSPPKPPVPEPTGEPKQYGMMKVHHPDAVKKLVSANERDRAAEKHTEKTSPHLRRAPSPHHEPSKREPALPRDLKQPLEPRSSDTKVEDQPAQWRGNLNVSNSYAPWSTHPNLPSTSPSVKNPWKPLSSDRTLGNGIFDQTLGGFPSRDLPLRSQLGLDQAAMPPQTFSGPPEAASVSSLPSPETRRASYDTLSPIGHPGPIGPPSSQHSQWQQHDSPAVGLGAWNNFPAIARKREAEEAEKYRKDFQAASANRDRPTPTHQFEETWKQVRSGDKAEKRNVIVEAVANNEAGSPSNPLTGLDAPVDGLPFSDNHSRPLVSVPTRSSRFFPHATEQPKRPPVEKLNYQRSPSPPPPEEISSHPVYSNGSGRPLVHLPTPKPVVKLPPKAMAASMAAAPAAPPPPPTFASMAAAPPRATPAPVSTAISWQEKINGLFGKKTPAEKKTALAVASATKEPLDVQIPAAAVSVSLPNIETIMRSGDGDIAARQVAEEEEIFEDREPGSQPGVRVPNMAPPAAWHAAPAPSPSRLRAKSLKPMQVHSIEPFFVGVDCFDQFGNLKIYIRPAGVEKPKLHLVARPSLLVAKLPFPYKSDWKIRTSELPAKHNKSKKTPGLSSSTRHQSRNAAWGPSRAQSSSH